MNYTAELLRGRSLVVTGGTGFLGSALVRDAVDAGAQVVVLGRATSDRWRLASVEGGYQFVDAPLESLANLSLTLPEGTLLVHAAAAGVSQRDGTADALATVNVDGTRAVAEWALRHACGRLIVLGTSGEYGAGVGHREDAALRPTSEYGRTRAKATRVARDFGLAHGLDVVVVRPFAVYGPFEAAYRLVPHVILSALRGEPARISSGEQTRDYIHVTDVISGIALASTAEAARAGVFNICTGVETSVREAAALAVELVDPAARLHVGAVPGIPGDMARTTGDPTTARRVLGWEPQKDLRRGLTETVEWFRSVGRDHPAYEAPMV